MRIIYCITLTQEGVRIIRKCRIDLSWKDKARHMTDFSARMKASAYSEGYRQQVIMSAVGGFDKMVEMGGSIALTQINEQIRIIVATVMRPDLIQRSIVQTYWQKLAARWSHHQMYSLIESLRWNL